MPGTIEISSVSMHSTQLPMISACLVLSHGSILSAGSKVTAMKAPVGGAEQGQGHLDAHRKPRSNTGGHCSSSLCSRLQETPKELTPCTQHRCLQGTSHPPFVMGTVGSVKAVACSGQSGSDSRRCLGTDDYSTSHLHPHPPMPGA